MWVEREEERANIILRWMEWNLHAATARNELWNNRGQVFLLLRIWAVMRCGRCSSLSVREATGDVTSALIVYIPSRWDFIIVPMSSTVATEREKGMTGQKAAMGGAIKNHDLPREPLAKDKRNWWMYCAKPTITGIEGLSSFVISLFVLLREK